MKKASKSRAKKAHKRNVPKASASSTSKVKLDSSDEVLEIKTSSINKEPSVKVNNNFVDTSKTSKPSTSGVAGKKVIKAALKNQKKKIKKEKADTNRNKRVQKANAKKSSDTEVTVNQKRVNLKADPIISEEKPVNTKEETITKTVTKKVKTPVKKAHKNKKTKTSTVKKSTKATKSKTTKSKKVKRNFSSIITASFLTLVIIGIYVGLFLLYGPWNGFRDWFITTAMSTMNHQYFAHWFYSDETIAECLSRNRIIEVDGVSDKNLINIADFGSFDEEVAYANEYERQILERDPNNNDYKIIKLEGDTYDGYMAVIYDPSRIEVATAAHLGSYGEYLTDISQRTDALVAINAGGFMDYNGQGSGASPLGITISKGELVKFADSPYGVVGFTNEDKLLLGRYSYQEVLDNGFRDAVSFGPYLIMNGVSSEVVGNGGWGNAPRTAIGQRADGIVLFLVLDGNRVLGKGASITDMIEIFERYGAVNATNLDGGTSTSMTVKGKTVNNPSNLSGANVTRPIPTAFILKPDDSDDGDYSAVQDKVDR